MESATKDLQETKSLPTDLRKSLLIPPNNVEDWMKDKLAGIVVPEEDIAVRVSQIGKDITAEFKSLGSKYIFLVGVLNGAATFVIDLIRHIELPVSYEFVKVASYGTGTEHGKLEMTKDLETDIRGKDVLLVEDIVDTGYTYKYLIEYLASKEPRTLRTSALLDKPERRKVDAKIDYLGFTIRDLFVVGYGLDFCEWGRNHRHISVLKPEYYRDEEMKKLLYSSKNSK
jgi:hypoxanthine phosphoribosyltransferase